MSQEPTKPSPNDNFEQPSYNSAHNNGSNAHNIDGTNNVYNGKVVASADGDVGMIADEPTIEIAPAQRASFADDEFATTVTPQVGQAAVISDGSEEPVTTTPAKGKRRKSFWREVLETIILTVLIFFLVKSLVQNFRIQGTSMEPNFHTDQYILVNKVAYFHVDINAFLRIIPGVSAEGVHNIWLFGGPHRGDVIVFQYPKAPQDDYIKRVIALPGERVAVHHNIAYVNGKALDEPYIKQEEAFGYTSEYAEITVPPDTLFVMGDNRNGSSDSRIWGLLPDDNIIGKAWFDYWPLFKPGWGFVPEIHPQFAP